MAETGHGDTASPVERLSERQRQCLALVAQGRTSKEIGRELNLSPSTVDNHLRAALERLNVRSRSEAVRAIRIQPAVSPQRDVPPSLTAERASLRAHGATSLLRLPPLGGCPNQLSVRRRAFHVVQIALLGVMGLTALVMTIAGLVALLSR